MNMEKDITQSLSIVAMNIAKTQNGVREATLQNDGAKVEEYLRSAGLAKGYSWCMAFVYWSYEQAAQRLGIKNPLVKTGGCLRQWNETPTTWHFKSPKVGDIFILDHGKGMGHTGIVTSVDPIKGRFGTVEGNTNTNGSANGDGVYLRDRPMVGGKLKGFIRIT